MAHLCARDSALPVSVLSVHPPFNNATVKCQTLWVFLKPLTFVWRHLTHFSFATHKHLHLADNLTTLFMVTLTVYMRTICVPVLTTTIATLCIPVWHWVAGGTASSYNCMKLHVCACVRVCRRNICFSRMETLVWHRFIFCIPTKINV